MRGDAGSGAREQMRRDAGNEVRGSKSRQRETRVDPACESHTHARTHAGIRADAAAETRIQEINSTNNSSSATASREKRMEKGRVGEEEQQ